MRSSSSVPLGSPGGSTRGMPLPLLHLSGECFILRDGGSVSHLDPIATMVVALLADHTRPDDIAIRLGVDLGLVRSVADLLGTPLNRSGSVLSSRQRPSLVPGPLLERQ